MERSPSGKGRAVPAYQVTFAYDGANRVTSQTLLGGRTVLFGWDAKGPLTSLAPPGRPAHGFSHTPVDLIAESAPPEVGQGSVPGRGAGRIPRNWNWKPGDAAPLDGQMGTSHFATRLFPAFVKWLTCATEVSFALVLFPRRTTDCAFRRIRPPDWAYQAPPSPPDPGDPFSPECRSCSGN